MVLLRYLIALGASLKLVSGEADSIEQSLAALDPSYIGIVNKDYNEAQDGETTFFELKDIQGFPADSAAECALLCIQNALCNSASWYGDRVGVDDGTEQRNCWLKTLEPPCQLPADAENWDDNRYFLIARPPECSSLPELADPPPPAAPEPPAGPPATAGTPQQDPPTDGNSIAPETRSGINTDEERLAVLGDRVMDADVPSVSSIENSVNSVCRSISTAVTVLGVCFVPFVLL